MIDILNLEPTTISRSLKGKYIFAFGRYKIGKTSLIASFPKSLILSFEPGTNALSNVYTQPIKSWKDFRTVLKQLSNPRAQEKYDFIGIDTVDVAYELCERYICDMNNVDKIGDIPYGGGWTALKTEFSRVFREIAQSGYGIIFISHSIEKPVKNSFGQPLKDSNGENIVQISPAAPSVAVNIVNKLVDFIIYIGTEYDDVEGNPQGNRYMYLKGTPYIQAGSRFKYLPDKIPFGYESLVNAVNDAIDAQIREEGVAAEDFVENQFFKKEEKRPFNEVMDETRAVWEKILTKDDSDSVLDKLDNIIINNFGSRISLSGVIERQQDTLELTLEDLKEFLNNM